MAVRESSRLEELRRRHRGPVISPGEDGYDTARATFNGMLDRRPAVVTRPLDVDDVVATIEFAVASELPVSVRGGGHGVAGHCVGDGSVVIDLRLMREVDVDPEARTATCGGGALWEDFDPPCQRHGLATTGGTFGDTGVAGLTLSGGIGHLMGLHGLALDNLLAARVVGADGVARQASEDEDAELFWAIRGGGGNFGAVVDFTFRLHPVGRLFGGLLRYRLEDARDVVSAWRAVMTDAPDELACFVQAGRSAVGRGVGVAVAVAYFGDPDDGRDAIRPLTEGVAAVQNDVRPMYYPELQEIFGRVPFGLRHYWSGRFLRELPDDAVDQAVGMFDDPRVEGGVLLEPLHGAAARVPANATAFAGREARYNATFLGMWTDPADDESNMARARAFSAGLDPWALGGGYLNYASEPAGDNLETEYGALRFRRLRETKRRLDPTNVFRFNHNIAPD